MPLSRFLIREYATPEPRDLENLNRLLKALSESSPEIADPLTVIGQEDYFVFIVEDKDNPGKWAGMASIFFRKNFATWLAEIHDVVVLEEYRGCHLGGALLRRLIDEAQKKANDAGSPVQIALTSKPKRVAANAMYQKYGFQLTAEAAGEKGTNLYRLTVEPKAPE